MKNYSVSSYLEDILIQRCGKCNITGWLSGVDSIIQLMQIMHSKFQEIIPILKEKYLRYNTSIIRESDGLKLEVNHD